ncbi:hypothetical protein [Nesterenkonia massiliensis]|uniref:hypothetical protein n=1 Tax=Nesterenkonia massiliensis TaxID=1232429 RepID=UPI0003F53DB4|nr:hypothetical protein [Nesterenkonia massiliensis]
MIGWTDGTVRRNASVQTVIDFEVAESSRVCWLVGFERPSAVMGTRITIVARKLEQRGFVVPKITTVYEFTDLRSGKDHAHR